MWDSYVYIIFFTTYADERKNEHTRSLRKAVVWGGLVGVGWSVGWPVVVGGKRSGNAVCASYQQNVMRMGRWLGGWNVGREGDHAER